VKICSILYNEGKKMMHNYNMPVICQSRVIVADFHFVFSVENIVRAESINFKKEN